MIMNIYAFSTLGTLEFYLKFTKGQAMISLNFAVALYEFS